MQTLKVASNSAGALCIIVLSNLNSLNFWVIIRYVSKIGSLFTEFCVEQKYYYLIKTIFIYARPMLNFMVNYGLVLEFTHVERTTTHYHLDIRTLRKEITRTKNAQ